jgi:hypothetical protein
VNSCDGRLFTRGNQASVVARLSTRRFVDSDPRAEQAIAGIVSGRRELELWARKVSPHEGGNDRLAGGSGSSPVPSVFGADCSCCPSLADVDGPPTFLIFFSRQRVEAIRLAPPRADAAFRLFQDDYYY